MQLPELSHLQFLIIAIIGGHEMAGRTLRQELKDAGKRMTGPAFYQLMSRLEEAELVEGRYEKKEVEGHVIKERIYKVTGLGALAYEEAVNFYLAGRERKLAAEGGGGYA